ncbi:MAG: DUF3881 family protein [Lachnospiraceae bacterium]
MHSFLEAIGFYKIKKEKLNEILDDIIQNPEYMETGKDSSQNEFVTLSKNYGESFGIRVCGSYLDNDEFRMDFYYPYFIGSGSMSEKSVEIEKHAEKESYAAICDDIKIGVILIFYVQNVNDCLQELQRTKNETKEFQNVAVTLSALSLSGKILLPILKTEKQIRNSDRLFQERTNLIAAARDGDEEAIESLTLEDIDTYSKLSRRVMNEDVLSIVDTYFMPYGIESDQYSIMGEIINCYQIENKVTNEQLYVITVDANDLIYDVCINKRDLMGEPQIGRRFKGNIWMQGTIHFES